MIVPVTLDVTDAGDYTFSGYFTYEGGETATRQRAFTVVAPGEAKGGAETSQDQDSTSILPWIVAGLLALAVVALIVMLLANRRARKSPSAAETAAAEPTEEPAGESAR